MATADQVKSLIKAHIEQDDERFKTITLQIAANEARHGHDTFARELKQYAEKIGKGKKNLIRLNNNGNGMFLVTYPSERLSDLVVSSEIQERIERLLIEYRNRNKLQKYGLSNRRKILIEGRPGTGKTFTASVIAAELDLPLYTIQMDKVVTKFMGETSTKLRQIFDNISTSTGVYFFDEFDAIGADRSLDNEVGEARRILNTGDDKPAEVVRSRLKKLNADHIRFVLDSLAENTAPVRNMKQYLLAMLYNAPTTMNLYYQNKTNHDFARGSPKAG